MELNLIGDRVVQGKLYPAGATWNAIPYTQGWREFERHWPHTVPLRLQEYCEHHGGRINIQRINTYLPNNTYYAVGIGFFNFDVDYFDLIPDEILTQVWMRRIRVLFYYHEGDNPARIKQRLDELVAHHDLAADSYVFVSGNTAAKNIPGFFYFSDFELWYYQRNRHETALPVHTQPRSRDFTALVRLHKSWRATIMADLFRNNLLLNSYWSYCERPEKIELHADNPIEIDTIGMHMETVKFLTYGPYLSDTLDNAQRNDHSHTESKYHTDSYCNIVIETHWDADQSGGAFLTEKTFKPIKHGQMFFVAGCAGSLQTLRELGYRVFDGILDNSYDLETDNTQRWIRLRSAIEQASVDLPALFKRATADIEHNQQLFLATKTNRLNILLEQLNEPY